MQTIALVGPTGMLGSMVYNVLKDKYNLVLIFRNQEKLAVLDDFYGSVKNHNIIKFDFDDLYQDYYVGFNQFDLSPKTIGNRKIFPFDLVIMKTSNNSFPIIINIIDPFNF